MALPETIKDLVPDDAKRLRMYDQADKFQIIKRQLEPKSGKMVSVTETFPEEEYNRRVREQEGLVKPSKDKYPAYTMVSAMPSVEYPDQPKDLISILLFELTPGIAKEFYHLASKRNPDLTVDIDTSGMDKVQKQTLASKLYKLKKAGLIRHVKRGTIMISPNHLVSRDPVVHYKWDQLKP